MLFFFCRHYAYRLSFRRPSFRPSFAFLLPFLDKVNKDMASRLMNAADNKKNKKRGKDDSDDDDVDNEEDDVDPDVERNPLGDDRFLSMFSREEVRKFRTEIALAVLTCLAVLTFLTEIALYLQCHF